MKKIKLGTIHWKVKVKMFSQKRRSNQPPKRESGREVDLVMRMRIESPKRREESSVLHQIKREDIVAGERKSWKKEEDDVCIDTRGRRRRGEGWKDCERRGVQSI